MAKKIDVDLAVIEELASKGYSVLMICSAIGISKSYAYAHADVMEAIKAGGDKAKQKVIDDLMARSENDQSATASIFLAKQLKVFDTYFATSSPQSPSDALKKISNIYVAVARNELSEEKGTHLIGYLEKYVKAYEVSELDDRISKLESEVNARK